MNRSLSLLGAFAAGTLSMHLDIPPEQEELLQVEQDRTQLLVALFNLVENAVKYSRGEAVEVRLSLREGHPELSIALRVLEKNGIAYRIDSCENEGTRVTLTF